MRFLQIMLLVMLSLPVLSWANELNDDDQVAYTSALQAGDMKVIKKFVDSGKVEPSQLFFGWSSLQIAANKGQLPAVKYLAEKGADLNYQHPMTKLTALQLAAYNNSSDVVKYLAEKGADVNKKMRGGVSIIRGMKDEGNTKMVDLLTSLGAKDDGCQEEKCN